MLDLMITYDNNIYQSRHCGDGNEHPKSPGLQECRIVGSQFAPSIQAASWRFEVGQLSVVRSWHFARWFMIHTVEGSGEVVNLHNKYVFFLKQKWALPCVFVVSISQQKPSILRKYRLIDHDQSIHMHPGI